MVIPRCWSEARTRSHLFDLTGVVAGKLSIKDGEILGSSFLSTIP